MLEAERSLTLAEKAGAGAEEIIAAPGFRVVATMNPGGDYGKRELSPALSNRFTSLWVPATSSLAELECILHSRMEGQLARTLKFLRTMPVVFILLILHCGSFLDIKTTTWLV